MSVSLIVLCAGESSRFQCSVKKQWLRIKDQPLWLYVTKRIENYYDFDKIIVVGHKNELNYMKSFFYEYHFVPGGSTRQGSISNALSYIDTEHVMITDVARCCIPKEVIHNLIANKQKADVIVPAIGASDTVVYDQETINRDNVKLIQTPQLSKLSSLKNALETDKEFTDESSAIKSIGGSVYYIQGSQESRKLTFGDEMKMISCLQKPSSDMFTGSGIDIHQFQEGKQMVLGGVKIDSPFGYKAHSDGDVLIHSVIDAILGACGAGDIGEFFPDTDPAYKGADSKQLLEYILQFVKNVGYEIVNIDFTILTQQPKINPYKMEIKKSMAKLLLIEPYRLNVKATTAEKMGFVGRNEGTVVISSATLKYSDWTKEEI